MHDLGIIACIMRVHSTYIYIYNCVIGLSKCHTGVANDVARRGLHCRRGTMLQNLPIISGNLD
jgi:hypothetical protein